MWTSLSGLFAFVAHSGGLRGADHLTGQRVALAQPGHVLATQDPRHDTRWHAEFRSEPGLTFAVLGPRRKDLAF